MDKELSESCFTMAELNVHTHCIKLFVMTKGNNELKVPSIVVSSQSVALLFFFNVACRIGLQVTYNHENGFSENLGPATHI